jgi:hypothetical protein
MNINRLDLWPEGVGSHLAADKEARFSAALRGKGEMDIY